MDPGALRRAVGLIEARGAIAQIRVLRHGQVVLDRAFGCRPDSLFLIFSAGKPFVAMLVHKLAERGTLDLDDPVVRFWPEFGRHGKDTITIRQVLQHRAGLPVAHGLRRDALAAPHWRRAVHGLELARPSWPPGEVPAYHVPVRGHGPVTRVRQVVFNRRGVRAAVVPAATVSTTARDLTRFYLMLLRGGEVHGVRVLRPETVAQATAPSANGQTDRLLRLPVRWSQGFQLGGPPPDPAPLPADGRRQQPGGVRVTTAPTAAWPGQIPAGDSSSPT